MTDKKNDGGAAYPMIGNVGHNSEWVIDHGMTLRDYFAGQELAGLLAGGFADTVPHDDKGGGNQAAAFAYQYATAMLKERGE